MGKVKNNDAVTLNTADSDELPDGWALSSIGQLYENWGGATPSKSQPRYWNGEVPWLSSKDIKTLLIESGDEFVTKAALQETRLRLCPVGTVVLVVRSGILTHLLPVAQTTAEVVINQDLKAFYCKEPQLNGWLAFALRAQAGDILSQNRKDGTTVQSIMFDGLKLRPLPIPPLPEQRRIVAKVDSLLERVNKARERLSRVPDILRRFRQSVLAAACSGRLTADWREEDGESEDLPGAWERRSLSSLCKRFEYGSSKKSESDGEVPVLRMGNIQNGEIDWSDLKFTSDNEEIEKYTLEPNTVLFNRTNSPELVGKTAIYRGERPAVFAGYLIRIQHGPDLNPEYLNYCLNATEFREYCSQVKTDGVSQSNINAKKLAAYEMPWCELSEQNEIVCRVKMLFEVLSRVEQHASFGTQRTELVTQSVLTKAFAGELVETEADLARREGRYYEPASVLLQRLAAEQSETTSAIRLERGRAILDILLLLEAWNQPVSISALEPALVLMRNDAARQVLLNGPATRRRRRSVSNEPQFIRGLDVIYNGLVANGAIRRVGQAGFQLENSQLLSQANAGDRAKAAEVIRAIQTLSDLRSLSQVVASITHEQYEIIV